MSAFADKVPVFILTGFLGSGKTTLLASLLAHPQMRDTAVIVNELGEIGLDHLLVREVTEEIVLLNSGCLCCSVRGDLASTLEDLRDMRGSGGVPPFGRVAVETTGLADPAPVVQTLLGERRVRGDYALCGVIATIDGVFGERQLDEHAEALKQAAIADRLILTKSDLAQAPAVERLRSRLARLNPGASVHESAPDRFPAPDELLGAAGFDPGKKTDEVRRWLNAEAYSDSHRHADRHDDRIGAFCVVLEGPLDWDRWVEWLELLLSERGAQVLRTKGILNVAGRENPLLVQGVQHMVYRPAELRGWPDEDRRSRIVFVTRDLSRAAVERSLRQVLGVRALAS